jgi:N-acetylmuramoyl-L-alanine amidase
MRRTLFLPLALLLILGWPAPSRPQGPDDSVLLRFTDRAGQAQVSFLHDLQGKPYIPLGDLAKFYGMQLGFDSQTRQVSLSLGGKVQVKMVLSSPLYLSADGTESSPMEPAEMVSGQLGIPPESATELLQTVLNEDARYLPDQRTLDVGDVPKTELRQEILAEAERSEDSTANPASSPAAQVPKGVSAAVPSTGPGAREADGKGSGSETHPQPGKVEEEIPQENQIYQVRRIIIDPGHGGLDAGAKGYDKRYCEKQATLDIAKKVAAFLKEEPGLEVYLTRDADYYITLNYRTEFANAKKGDLFVSIHCNSNPREKAHGTEIYYYSTKASNKVAAVAAVRENGGNNLLDLTLNDLHTHLYRQRSYELADKVDKNIRTRLGQHIRPILKGPFWVLCHVDMPSILVETAFISNKEEEVKLRDPYWRDKIAKAISDGILEYKGKVDASIENIEARR